jgi:hypothetical protein
MGMQRALDLIERLGQLFGDVEDMADMDAADFKDNAGEIWAMRQEARTIVEEHG